MKAKIPPSVVERHTERIAAFVVRARRVEAHSLLTDLQRFNRWAEGTTEISSTEGVMSMTQDVPPEEAFESLAARCRPLLLTGDPIHWEAVFGSLRAFLKVDPRFGPTVEALRASWGAAVAPNPERGFAMLKPDEVVDQAVWFDTLADSWLYGDLVHADPAAREKASGHTLNSRYSAAVLLYGQVAIHTLATLNLIRQAGTAGLIELPQEAFSEPVTATVPMRFPMVGFVKAEVGTPVEDMLAALDAEDLPPPPDADA